jgi:tetratricopeptide (TPR) repeat protein
MKPRPAPLLFVLALSLLVPTGNAWSQATRQSAGSAGAGTVAAGAGSAAGAPSASLALLEPYWEGFGNDSEGRLHKVWRAALAQASQDLAGRLVLETLPWNAKVQAGRPFIRAILSGEPGSYTALFKLERGEESLDMKYCPFEAVEPSLYLEFARALEALARPVLPKAVTTAPVLVDSFPLGELQGVDLPSQASNLYPYGIAEGLDGSLLVACGFTVLELDQSWQVRGLPAKSLSDEGNMGFAYGIQATPAGRIFVRGMDGMSLWSFAPGAATGERLRLDLPVGSSFGVMDDGSPFVVAMQPRLARVWRQGSPGAPLDPSAGLDLPLAKDAIVFGAAAGPDDTIWLPDTSRTNIRIVTPEGILRDIVYPELPQGSVIMKLRVLADGSFIAATNADLRRFGSDGRLLWTWDGRAEGLSILFSATDLIAGPDGLFYVSDTTGRRIIRLSERPASLPPALARVAAATRASLAERRKPEPWLALADAYEAMGGYEAARLALGRYLELRPADAAAADRKVALQAALVKSRASAAEAEVASILKRFGPETAREAYTRAMRALESLRALLPQDPAVPARMAALRKLMSEAEGGSVPAPQPAPTVERVEFASLFPALLQVYRSRPAGSVLVRNDRPEALRDLRAELFIPRYMDYPASGPVVPRLEPGAEARLGLAALLNEKVLDIEEDIPVQALVTLRYSDSGGERSFELTRQVVLYRRSALTWDDTGKLACFVTPNEDTVAREAFRMQKARPGAPAFSESLRRAAAICDALGALPLAYVPDPASSFDAASEDHAMVDTVRFARTTLAYGGGDCDDTTALLASLLEAAGLRTAILTSPGHVFLAFDSGEKAESAWLFAAPGFETIASGGRLWIPLESTSLGQGFTASWKAASTLVARYRTTPDFGFLVLSDARASYPALPLPPSSLPVPTADPEALSALDAAAAADLERGLYSPVRAALETARKGLSGRDWSKGTNRIAQLESRFGRTDRARAALAEIVARDPGYVAAYLNLASLCLGEGRRDEALAWLGKASAAAPGSSQVADYAARAGLAPSGLGGASATAAQGGPAPGTAQASAAQGGGVQTGTAQAGGVPSGGDRAAVQGQTGWED